MDTIMMMKVLIISYLEDLNSSNYSISSRIDSPKLATNVSAIILDKKKCIMYHIFVALKLTYNLSHSKSIQSSYDAITPFNTFLPDFTFMCAEGYKKLGKPLEFSSELKEIVNVIMDTKNLKFDSEESSLRIFNIIQNSLRVY